MTHKQECIAHCMQYLQQLSLSNIFDLSHFNHYYRKFNCSYKNAFTIGLNSADYIIYEANRKKEVFNGK